VKFRLRSYHAKDKRCASITLCKQQRRAEMGVVDDRMFCTVYLRGRRGHYFSSSRIKAVQLRPIHPLATVDHLIIFYLH